MDYIVDYLCETVGPSIARAGEIDRRVDKRTEAGMCETFRRYIVGEEGDEGNQLFRVVNDQILCVFNGRFFERITDVQLTGVIRRVLRRMEVGLVYLTGSASTISKYVIDSMLAEPSMRFHPDRRYVCFDNCVLDLRTMKVKEHGPQYCTDVIMNFEYSPGARSALWDRVIETTVPDEGMRRAFQQFCGAFLLNRHEYKFEYVCFVIGEGQNGKSIICKAMVNVFKNEDERGNARTKCVTTYTPDQLFRSQQMQYVMADVQGKVMNYCDDVSDKDFSGGDFKAFVSGGEFRGRSPYGKEVVEVTDVPLMLCCANRIPPTTDDSEGYFRRFLIINCPNHVSERDKDPQLEAKLRADDVRAAIFNWMVEGYGELMKNACKIEMTGAIQQLREDMKAESNSCRRWIREYGYVAVEPTGVLDERWKSLREWLGIYKQYCIDYAEGAPKTQKSVSKIFKEMGFASQKRKDGVWYCIGRNVDEELRDDGVGSEDNLPF
jgi:putative DNA primase/helicase